MLLASCIFPSSSRTIPYRGCRKCCGIVSPSWSEMHPSFLACKVGVLAHVVAPRMHRSRSFLPFVLFLSLCAFASLLRAGERPNILWLIGEDFSQQLGCYGEKLVKS